MNNRRVTHSDLTWLVHIIETLDRNIRAWHDSNTSQNKHRGTIHNIYKWIHSEVTITSIDDEDEDNDNANIDDDYGGNEMNDDDGDDDNENGDEYNENNDVDHLKK